MSSNFNNSLTSITDTRDKGTPQIRTTRFDKWQDQLDKSVLQSINFHSNPSNLNKQESESVSSWVIAGVSKEGLNQFQKLANKFGIFSDGVDHNTEGFGIEELQVVSFKPSSPSTFIQLQKLAEKLGLELWQEVELDIGGTGPVDTGTIQEGTFVENLDDADTAIDVNGDGTTDPLWHLLPSDSANAQYGLNAIGAWNSVSGEDVNVGVFDELFDLNHSDLNSAMPTNFDWNGDGMNDGVDSNADGLPDVFEDEHFTLPGGDIDWPVVPGGDRAQSHGTAVAGIALGRVNGQSGIGVAPESNFMPNGFLENGNLWPSSDYFGMADVINHSWGSSSGLGRLRTAPVFFQANWQTALDNAIEVKSAGNSRQFWDNTNNSMVSNRKNIIVGATMANGEVEDYSTPGASLFVSAPVNGSNVRWETGKFGTTQFTTTSDVTDAADNNADNRGYANGSTTSRFNGTSAAAPMVTGAVAMMLEANPSLTLRDVQHILAETSVKNGLMDSDGDGSLDSINPNAGGDAGNPDDPAGASTLELRDSFSTTMNTTPLIADGHNTGWFQNGAGHWVSDSFGFGIVDAGAAVQAATNWTNVSDELKATTNTILSNPYTIPEDNLGGLDSLTEAGSWTVQEPLKVEWVELTLDLNLPEQDEVMLAVQSPSGTRSVLMAPGGNNAAGYNSERTLITNQFWGEPSNGEWSVEVLDTRVDGDAARISNAKLEIYGTCDQQSPLKVTPFDEHASNGFGLDKLAEKFLADGGANSSHYDLLAVNPYGDARSFGTFKSGLASGLKIDQGTIFTTGHAKDAIGPNSAPNTTTDWQEPGMPLLGANSKDASGLEIRFKAKKDMVLGWNAQFGSEEYDEWSPSIFDDKAGIFFTQIRERNLPIEGFKPRNLLSSPSNGAFSVNGFSENESVFKKSILMNEPCGPLTWEYDGTTNEAIPSQQVVLEKGKTYAIVPVIADATDHIYDSGIIIGPNKSALVPGPIIPGKKLDTPVEPGPIIPGKKLDTLLDWPDFEKLSKREYRRIKWSKFDSADLTEEQIDSINWDNVKLRRKNGVRAFNYENADWDTIIQSDNFGSKAAKMLRTDMLPAQSLSQTAMDQMLQLGSPLTSTQMEELMA